MNKWQKTIEDLVVVLGTAEKLLIQLNKMTGDKSITNATLSRIRAGKITKVEHDLGQALLILHVRYVKR